MPAATGRLYGHMEFKELSEEFCGQMRETLIKALREEENFGYMKGEARWQELLESCGEGSLIAMSHQTLGSLKTMPCQNPGVPHSHATLNALGSS